MKTLLALSFITYSRVVSGGACSEPSTPHVRGGKGPGEGGEGGTPVHNLPTREPTPTARPSMFDSIRDKLGCATTYDNYVGESDETQPLTLFSLERGDSSVVHKRLFLNEILLEAKVGDLEDFKVNCIPGDWHYANTNPKPEAGATEAIEEAIEDWKNLLKPFLAEEEVFSKNYKNPIDFPKAPTPSTVIQAEEGKIYFCARKMNEGEDPLAERGLEQGTNLMTYANFLTSREGSFDLKACDPTNADNGKIAEVICAPRRRDLLRKYDSTVFDAHVEGIRTLFDRRMEWINQDGIPSMQQAVISKRKTCLMTQTFNDTNVVVGARSIFQVPACQCSQIDASAFTAFGGRRLDMKKFQCKWGLDNYMLSSENVRPCLAAQTWIEVSKELSAPAEPAEG